MKESKEEGRQPGKTAPVPEGEPKEGPCGLPSKCIVS